MKRKGIISILISLTLVMAMILSACGSKEPDTLENFINNDEEAKASIEEQAATSGLDVKIEGNVVTYTYDIKDVEGMTEEMANSEIMIESLESALNSSSDQFVNLCKQLEDESKIEGISLVVTYTYNGETLVTKTFMTGGDAAPAGEEDEEAGE